ncbi:MAG: sigma-54-dependent Fis family transcriptional regulator [Calditrichae bacterium]|nr:sigma-54-dependent Fis family transcriptional regulator [Calditrichota bacterium]MCB9057759.1 sigma-54-dependent Fis family transcriptional regulator [Calditrichia bacterium]
MTNDNNTILIVDDQQEILNSLRRIFQREYNVLTASDGNEGLQLLQQNQVKVILSDQRMPGMDGVTFLKKANEIQSQAVRIMITGYADIEASINAVNEAKIYQYVSKPFEPDELKLVVKSAVDRFNLAKKNEELKHKLQEQNEILQKENTDLKSQFSQQLDLGNFIGYSAPMQRVFKLVKKVMNTPTTVLLLGETGTGKEMLAKMIHYNSNRSNKVFVVQNCGAIPDTLLQSELFGHVKGAFTGALKDKKGLFEQADTGTIFLDEIGDTSQALQLGLLRVLQEGEIKPVGGTQTKKVDVRVIAATNRDLITDVAEGRFREDLYYRLNVFPIVIPPLRQRKEDIPDLVNFFVKKYSQRINKNITGVSQNVLSCFTNANFPGNVRELENEIERMVTLADENTTIGTDIISDRFLKEHKETDNVMEYSQLKPAIEKVEKALISKALMQTSGNILKAAEQLGVSRVGLHKMLNRYEINAADFKNNN